MGKAKSGAATTITLTEKEFSLLKAMSVCLAYNVAKDQIMSAFLSYVAHHRLGVDEEVSLQFEIDLDKDRELVIKPIEPTDQ